MRAWALVGARILAACAVGVLLTESPAGAEHGPEVYVLGGPAAVDEAVLRRVEELIGVRPVRVSGPDRYATAAAVSRSRFERADTVVLASGETHADALSAGPAAARQGAPVLLVSRDAVPAATELELRRLAPRRVIVAGGPAAVSRAVQARIAATGAVVERVSGPDRFATSAALARLAAPRGARTVFLVSGRDFPDAMSAAAPATVRHAVVLLTDPAGLSADVRAELARLRPDEVVVVGGEAAVPRSVPSAVRAIVDVPVRRVSGPDRHATSAQVSRTFFEEGVDAVWLAAADRFADALTVGAVAERARPAPATGTPQEHGGARGVLLYAGRDGLSRAVEQELRRLRWPHDNGGAPGRSSRRPSASPSPSPSAAPTPSPAAPPPAPPAPPAAPPAPPPPPPAPNRAPVAADHSYADEPVFRNVLFVSGGGSPSAAAKTTHALRLLDGAADPDGDTLSVTDLDVTTGAGVATILDAAGGAFSYEPSTGGEHVLSYTVSDGELSDSGTVTIDVDSDRVVFVQPGLAGGSGASTDPAGSLATAEANSGPGDTILILPGDGSTLSGGIALQDGQRLTGRAAGLSLVSSGGTQQLLASSADPKPVITHDSGPAITLASGVTVEQVAVSQGAQPGITGGATTATATIRNVAVTTAAGNGIDLESGTYAVTGGVTVSSGTGTAFEQSSGTITVTVMGAGNTLTSAGGRALHVTGTTVTGGMSFRSISADGGANAITFSPTNGATATLTVTGSVSATSGGTIRNVTGDAVVVTAGAVSFAKMLFQDNDADTIQAIGAAGFSLDTVTFDDNGDAPGEHAVALTDVSGAVSITGATFLDGTDAQLLVQNEDTNATYVIDDSTFEDQLADGTNRAIQVDPFGGSSLTMTVRDSTFRNLGAESLRWLATTAGAGGSSALTFRANTVENTAAGRNSSVRVEAGASTITNVIVGTLAQPNTFTRVGGTGADGSLYLSARDNATLRGVVEANTFTDGGTHAIHAASQGAPVMPLLVTGNTIANPHGEAVRVDASAGTADLDVTVTGNTVTQAGDTAAGATGAVTVLASGQALCADVRDNDVGQTADAMPDIRLAAQAGGAIGYRVSHAAAVNAADVAARNVLAGVAQVSGTVTGNSDAACDQP